MNMRGVIIVCSLSGSIACGYLICSTEPRGSDLELTPSAFQRLDSVRQGEKSDVVYWMRNRTAVPVRIISVDTSCACSRFTLPKHTLAPGQRVPLRLEFSTAARRGTLSIRGVIAHTRDGEKQARSTPFGLDVGIDPDYVVDPPALAFGHGRPPMQRVCISPRHVSRVDIIKATCNLRFFKVTVLPEDTVNNRQFVEVIFLPNEYYADAGFAWLTVLTDCERQPTLRVPLDVVITE
jgi:hypothetical protein